MALPLFIRGVKMEQVDYEAFVEYMLELEEDSQND